VDGSQLHGIMALPDVVPVVFACCVCLFQAKSVAKDLPPAGHTALLSAVSTRCPMTTYTLFHCDDKFVSVLN